MTLLLTLWFTFWVWAAIEKLMIYMLKYFKHREKKEHVIFFKPSLLKLQDPYFSFTLKPFYTPPAVSTRHELCMNYIYVIFTTNKYK